LCNCLQSVKFSYKEELVEKEF